ncbi:MAG: nucleotidyltransferase domain-containing protein [Lachnospiraceae bacterium]|nr:nucleotidyltransferase domain-containing protein [Lachnospiraceae bacterium]
MPSEIYTVSQIKSILRPVFQRYNIRRAVLFGSYGKGCAKENSNLDLLVDSGLKGLNFVGFIEDVRVAIDKEVDIIDTAHLEKDSELDFEIQRTGVVIYEK